MRVAASIRGEGMTSKSAEVTFTHETWAEINRRMDRDFADERIVGWYHSHPDFGIFLSDRDLFIHEHFFPAPGQIAVVIDPVRDEEGVFVWQEGTLGRTKTYWVGAEPHASSGVPSVERMEAPRASEPRSGDHDRSALQPNGRGGSSVISTLLLGLALVGAMAIGMWLSGFGDRLRTMRSAEAIARQLAARTTSSESTIALSRALSRLAAIGQTLAPPPTDGTTPPAIDPAIRERLVKDLIGLERELNAALRGLDMSPEESLAIDMLLATRLKELQAAAAAQKAESEKAESEKAASEKAGGESAGTEKPAPAPAAPKGGT